MTTAELPIVTEPWQAAVERLAGKTPVATRLNNEEWSRLPLAVRERAIWSATLAQANVIQQLKDDLIAMKSMQTVDGRAMDRSRIVARARQTLGALPGDTDDLTDLTSFRRLQLIVDFQEQDANGYARYKTDLEDPDILDAEPAYRFTRIEQRDSERLDWPMRWAAAYARVGGQGALRSPMVALKTSPIWAALSRFGRPWPPFDFGSGMGLEGVDRFEAEDLGLLSPDDTLDGGQAIRDFNDGVEASARDLDPQTRSWVESAIGHLAQFIGDKSVLRAAPAPIPSTPSPARPPFVEPSVADALLEQGVTEIAADGTEVHFGERLKRKLDRQRDAEERKRFLEWAREAVRSGKPVSVEREGDLRTVFAQIFKTEGEKDAGMLVIVDTLDGEAFNLYRAEPARLRKQYGLPNRQAVKESLRPGEWPPAEVLQALAATGLLQDSN